MLTVADTELCDTTEQALKDVKFPNLCRTSTADTIQESFTAFSVNCAWIMIVSSATWGWLVPSLTTCWLGSVLGFVGWTPTTGVPSCLQSICPSVSGKWHPVLLRNYAPYNISVDPKRWLAVVRQICRWSWLHVLFCFFNSTWSPFPL